MRNQVVSSLIWLWWVIYLLRFEFESSTFRLFYLYSLFHWRIVLLVSWCVGRRCGMVYNDKDRGRSRRPGAEDQGWSHRSDTRWPGDREVGWRCVRSAPCTCRWEARVSWLGLKTKVDSLWVVWPQTHSDGFLSLDLKTGSSGLVIWVSKLPRWFLGLGLKIKQASVCRLHHKTDGGRSAQDTSGDLVTCFMWNQVWLGFFSLASRLMEAQRRVVYVAPS
jgi:hypothetical protein